MRRRILAATALMLVAGCAMEPKDIRPATPPVPLSWPAGDAYLRESEAALPLISYTQVFADPRLQQVIALALANNRDLQLAAANIEAARAQFRIQRAGQFPIVDAGASAGYSGGGRGTTAVAQGDGTVTNPVATSRAGQARFAADIGITAFELDLFGRLRSLTAAERNRWFATEAAARTVRLTLVGDIADAWLTYAADRSLMEIARATAANAERSVTLTRARLTGGIAPRTDLRQAELVLETARADLAEQRTALAQDVNLLRLLVGAEVDAALLPDSIEQAAPTIAPLPAGLDSGILLRRPDVVQAEYQLRAANAEIGAARAALFPRISLTGLVGFASDALGALFSGNAFTYSGSAGADYPIFRAGAGLATVRLTEAQRAAALASYERAVQTAFREVADALARRGTLAEQLRATQAVTAAAADTFRLTDARYRGGLDNFLASLDAQRSLYQAQRTLVATRLVGASNGVAVYRALGGDATLEALASGPRDAADGRAAEPVLPPPSATSRR